MCSTTRTVPCRAAPRRAAPRRAAPRRAAPRTRTLCLASRPRIVDAHPASVRPSHGLQNPATRAGEVCGFLGFVERLLLLGCFSVVCASIYFASEMVEALRRKEKRERRGKRKKKRERKQGKRKSGKKKRARDGAEEPPRKRKRSP